ncbi:MAG: hypothetical protein WB383_03445 [Acidimicrobiales bacterium]
MRAVRQGSGQPAQPRVEERPFAEGVEIIDAVQDDFLDAKVTIA